MLMEQLKIDACTLSDVSDMIPSAQFTAHMGNDPAAPCGDGFVEISSPAKGQIDFGVPVSDI